MDKTPLPPDSMECDDPLLIEKTLQAPEKQQRFKKRLIREVRKHSILYDTLNERFKEQSAKEAAWSAVGKALKLEPDICQNAWVDLRYDYQLHVRRLRRFFKATGKMRKRRHRPNMPLETEMLFLWRFVADRSHYPLPFEEESKSPALNLNSTEDDDIVLLEEEPEVVVIDLDDEDSEAARDGSNKYVIKSDIRKLVELIWVYPELYNTKHKYYNDYRRKGIIWFAIANELNDKATKLMKSWIQLQTRYEWQINQNKSEGEEDELETLLAFLKPYIKENKFTVYKQSRYLKQQWFEPIEHFKNIFNLLAMMKRMPHVVKITDDAINGKSEVKEEEYFSSWNAIVKSKVSGTTAGQCEVTWLILRLFYWELMTMRKHSYQLQDKWYFEAIITTLYAHVTTIHSLTDLTDGTSKVAVELDENKISASVIGTFTKNPVKRPLKPKMPTTTPASTPSLPMLGQAQTLSSSQLPPLLNFKISSINTPPANYAIQVQPQTTEQPMQPVGAKPTIVPTGPVTKITTSNLTEQIITPKIASAKSLAPIQTRRVLPAANKCVQIKALPTGAPQLQSSSQPQPMMPTIVSATSLNVNANVTPPPFAPSMPSPSSITSLQVRLPFQLPKQTSVVRVISPQAPVSVPTSTPAPAGTGTPVATATTAGANKVTNNSVNSGITTKLQLNPKVMELSQNEIMIELIASAKGNQLVVHGPPLAEKYSLSMQTTALFIRTVMGIPQLHNKKNIQLAQINAYWMYISRKFNLPSHICKACWNFLAENFNHFPQIAPMKELMKPFSTDIIVWKESQTLFNSFNVEAVAFGFLEYRHELPRFMEEIDNFSQKVPKIKGRKLVFSINWMDMSYKFPNLRAQMIQIWEVFKKVFMCYLDELENGIDNKWPENWWRTLAKMKFIVNERYHDMEPYYYIMNNKIDEEIQRCTQRELLITKTQTSTGRICSPTIQPPATPSPTLSIESEITTISKLKQKPNKQQTKRAKTSTDNEPSALQKIPDIDAYNLILVIRRHKDIFQKCDGYRKTIAWYQVAKEMNASVTSCRFAFQWAIKKYRMYAARDPSSRCRINQRYFKHLVDIYQSSKPIIYGMGKINIKTPNELNESIKDADSDNEAIFPERFVPEINMDNCKPALVMKNWAYAFNHLPQPIEYTVLTKLYEIFDKYRPYAGLPP